ncbi:Hypothetical protein GbCGDNIH4_2027 [Granulibacter bethesdensis CGDNIH4]|nr:Hypothetical protein GbCGDNIH4_2027 [Granulibacter bethesdensis CGDNIH4]
MACYAARRSGVFRRGTTRHRTESMNELFPFAVYAPAGEGGQTGPKPLTLTKKIDIAAPPDAVWAIISEFGDITWLPLVKSSSADRGNTPGSIRVLDLGGPRITEELTEYDAAGRSYSYKFTPDVENTQIVPAGDYRSTITVEAVGAGARIVWQGFFTRLSPLGTPPAGQGDEDAITAVTGVYDAGLTALKQKAEG